MQKFFDKIKDNVSKKLLVTLAMFFLGPYIAKANAAGWGISQEMVEKLLQGMFASGSVYVLVQGVKDWINAHHDGLAAAARNAAFPSDAMPNSDQNSLPGQG